MNGTHDERFRKQKRYRIGNDQSHRGYFLEVGPADFLGGALAAGFLAGADFFGAPKESLGPRAAIMMVPARALAAAGAKAEAVAIRAVTTARKNFIVLC